MRLYIVWEDEVPTCQGLGCDKPSAICRDFGDDKHYFCDQHAHLTDREAIQTLHDYLTKRNCVAVPSAHIRRILEMTR